MSMGVKAKSIFATNRAAQRRENQWMQKDPENVSARELRRQQDRAERAYLRQEARIRSEEERRKQEAERRRRVPIEQFEAALENL